MPGMVEAQRVAALVFDALKADSGPGGVSTLLGSRIYRDQVPAASALPAATVGVVSSVDTSTLGGVRVFDVVLIDVRVVTSGASYGPINPAADRVDAVVQGLGGPKNGAEVVKLRRDQVQAYLETEGGSQHVHLIQTYRTEAYGLP
jgi:hypothetical protein